MIGGFNTWLVQGHAQIHPEGAYPSGHKWESLRVESLGREVLVLVHWPLTPRPFVESHSIALARALNSWRTSCLSHLHTQLGIALLLTQSSFLLTVISSSKSCRWSRVL